MLFFVTGTSLLNWLPEKEKVSILDVVWWILTHLYDHMSSLGDIRNNLCECNLVPLVLFCYKPIFLLMEMVNHSVPTRRFDLCSCSHWLPTPPVSCCLLDLEIGLKSHMRWRPLGLVGRDRVWAKHAHHPFFFVWGKEFYSTLYRRGTIRDRWIHFGARRIVDQNRHKN